MHKLLSLSNFIYGKSLVLLRHLNCFCLFCRFISLPYMQSLPRPVGPASRVFYQVPDYLLLVDQDMDYPPQFRRELSRAFSLFYHLRPHAIVLSQVEQRPLSHYVDMDTYNRAALLYTDGSSPVLDQQRSVYAVTRGWRLSLRNSGHVIR